MHTRLFFGEIQQSKYDEAWQILSEFAQRPACEDRHQGRDARSRRMAG